MTLLQARRSISSFAVPLGGACLLLGSPWLHARTADTLAEPDADRRPWNILVESPEPPLQRLALTGIVHWQHAWVDSSEEDDAEDEFRRFRFGADARFLRHFRMAAKVNFDPDDGPFYDSLSQTYLSYSPHGNRKEDFERGRILFGKLKPHFTNEHSVSPKRLKTFERSLLPNQLNPTKSTGVLLGKSVERLSGSVALYSGEDSAEFGGTGQGLTVIAKGTWDPDGPWLLSMDFLGIWEEVETTPWIGHALSLSAEYAPFSSGHDWSVIAELIGGLGSRQQSDVLGVVVLSSWRPAKRWEFVARYQFAASSDPDGLLLQKRYERSVVSGAGTDTGDEYHAVYCGVNYLLDGDALKLMTGVECSRMNRDRNRSDFDAVTWFSGIRCYF